MSKKLTLETIKHKLQSLQHIHLLPGQIYKDNKTPLKFLCDRHGEYESSWQSLAKAQYGCFQCGADFKGKQCRLDAGKALEELAKVFPQYSQWSYVGEYTGNYTKVQFTCPEHGQRYVPLSTLRAGKGCQMCNIEAGLSVRKRSVAELARICTEVHGGKYSYQNTKLEGQYMTYECAEHGETRVGKDAHMKGQGCQKCYAKAQESRVMPFDTFLQMARKVHGDKYTYDESTYSRMTDKLKITCKTHGDFWQKCSYHVHAEAGCPRCAVTISKGETELADFVESLIPVIRSYKYAGRKEVDVYIPSLKLAIEYDGLPWHSTKYRTPTQQTAKAKELKVLGITLLRVFEDEWQDKRAQVESLIRARTGTLKGKVYARQCQLVEIDNSTASEFYAQHHIQGWRKSAQHLGLIHNGTLAAVMTLSQALAARGQERKEGQYELVRYASNIQVVGGASKLLKAWVAKVGAKVVISYSDNRLFSGGMYKALGFQEVAQVPPSYTYWQENSKERKHKSGFRKEYLPKILGERYNPQATERLNCELAGYYQVYDDGLTRWQLTL